VERDVAAIGNEHHAVVLRLRRQHEEQILIEHQRVNDLLQHLTRVRWSREPMTPYRYVCQLEMDTRAVEGPNGHKLLAEYFADTIRGHIASREFVRIANDDWRGAR
jgi:hypothetical protein